MKVLHYAIGNFQLSSPFLWWFFLSRQARKFWHIYSKSVSYFFLLTPLSKSLKAGLDNIVFDDTKPCQILPASPSGRSRANVFSPVLVIPVTTVPVSCFLRTSVWQSPSHQSIVLLLLISLYDCFYNRVSCLFATIPVQIQKELFLP